MKSTNVIYRPAWRCLVLEQPESSLLHCHLWLIPSTDMVPPTLQFLAWPVSSFHSGWNQLQIFTLEYGISVHDELLVYKSRVAVGFVYCTIVNNSKGMQDIGKFIIM